MLHNRLSRLFLLVGRISVLKLYPLYNDLDPLMQPLYGGISFEYGNVFDKRADMKLGGGIASGSAFLGINTIIGSVYAAYGIAEGGRNNYYLFLGQSFNHWRVGIGGR